MSGYYYSHFEEYHNRTFSIDPSNFLDPFIKRLFPGSHILGVGCGSGRDLLWLTAKGFKATGFERLCSGEDSGPMSSRADKNCIVHKKLIRDKIPGIIRNGGKVFCNWWGKRRGVSCCKRGLDFFEICLKHSFGA